MSARAATRGRGLFASAATAAVGWLIEPPQEACEERGAGASLHERGVVAVVGLGPRCGATTLARALGAELAARDPAGACAVTAAAAGGGVPIGSPAAGRLARELTPAAAGRARACGRLCLAECPDLAALAGAARWLAPLVLDVHDAAGSSAAAALADAVVLVGTPRLEPALAVVVAEALARVGPRPLVVLNRGADPRWLERADLELPESRMGAQLALAGREPRGSLGHAVAELADRLTSPKTPGPTATSAGQASRHPT